MQGDAPQLICRVYQDGLHMYPTQNVSLCCYCGPPSAMQGVAATQCQQRADFPYIGSLQASYCPSSLGAKMADAARLPGSQADTGNVHCKHMTLHFMP